MAYETACSRLQSRLIQPGQSRCAVSCLPVLNAANNAGAVIRPRRCEPMYGFRYVFTEARSIDDASGCKFDDLFGG